MASLDGRTAFVTGAGRGIGRAVALALAREGADVAICSRTQRELADVASEIEALGRKALAPRCDVTDPAQVREAVRAVVARFGRLDILVNNAGNNIARKPLARVSDEEWSAVLRVNLDGAFYATREALNAWMLPHRSGCVISVSSTLGRTTRPFWGPYTAAKAALEALSEVFAQETKDSGIRFYTVNPSAVRTALRRLSHPDEDPATVKPPEAVAAAFVELAAGRVRLDSGARVELDPATGKIR